MNRIRLWPGWRHGLSALILGAVGVAAFAPVRCVPLAFLSLAGLFHLWRRQTTPWQGAALGLLWGLAYFLTGISWVYVSLHDVGGMAAWMSAAATFLFCLFLALLYPAVCGALFVRCAGTGRGWAAALCFAALWTFSEWLRGHLFTGFPWLLLGYTQTPHSPLAAYAPVIGVYGVGFLLALISALLASAAEKNAWRVRLAYLLPAVALLLGGLPLARIAWTQPQGAPLQVSLLQGNVAQTLKWDPQHLLYSMDVYARLGRDYPAALQVFPETAIPLLLDRIPPDYLRELTRRGPVLLGAALREAHGGDGEKFYNGAVLFAPGQAPRSYVKAHLVPFGEFVPPGFAWFFDWVNIPLADFTAGSRAQRPLDLLGQKIAVDICYEDVFGEEIIRQLPEASLLINLSNTAWFGDSLAQPQHLQMAQMRAMETGRMMLRATNSGMTAAIRPDGEIAAALPAFTRGGLNVAAQGYAGETPFVRYGNAPALLLAAFALGVGLIRRKRISRIGCKEYREL